MVAGGCFCGKVRIDFTGEPVTQALCHCLDCRKISGGAFSNNAVIPEDNFKVTSGTPKKISKTADSSKEMTSYFCGDCGTTIYRKTDTFAGNVILKCGVIDDEDWQSKHTPQAELYAPTRVGWIPAVSEASQLQTMK